MSKTINRNPTPPSQHGKVGNMHFVLPSWSALLLIPVMLLVAGYLLVSQETELLLRAQELNLWLPTQLFFEERMAYPGGLASWLGCYLTQFFYYPWLGTAILCGLWFVICLLLVWVYRLRGVSQLLTSLVPMALMACLVQTGYWIYYQKLQGHIFVPTIGVLFATLCLVVQRLLDLAMPAKAARWAHFVWMAIVCIIGYPFFGAWALGATVLLTLHPAQTASSNSETTSATKWYLLPLALWRGERGVRLLFALVLIAAVPQIYYQRFFAMTERTFVYVAAIPSLRYGPDSFEQYRLPYYAIILALLIIITASWISSLRATSKDSDSRPSWIRGWGAAVVTLVFLFLAVFGVKAAWYHDPNFQKELAMNRAIEECDWERVLSYARDGSSGVAPTRQIVMYKNLALFRLGRAGDEMFLYPEGSTQQNAPWKIHMTQVGGKLIYFHYGKENFCYRWCMEDGVEFGWKAETLKLMVRTSLLNHEWAVARKYLNILKQTTFHRRWAERYEPLLVNHDAFDLEKLEASVQAGRPLLDEEHMREFAPIMHMMTYPDRLDGDNTLVEMYLLQTFANGNGDDLLFQEMTLICALIMKDIDLFWPRFMRYATLNPKVHMPRYYQEAAYLYGHLENKVDISHMPFDQSIKDTYDRFMQFNTQCGSMTEEQKVVAFRPQFGDTFYYFYFLVRNQKTN